MSGIIKALPVYLVCVRACVRQLRACVRACRLCSCVSCARAHVICVRVFVWADTLDFVMTSIRYCYS